MRERKDVIAALRRLRVQTGSLACLGCGYEQSCSVRGCAILRAAADLLEQDGAGLAPPNEWVSVEERLPPPNVRVLAYRPDEDDNSPYKYTNMWGWAVKESIRHKGITHWMYYPAPPDRRPPEVQS